MSNFLEYRPRLEYKKKLEAHLQEAMVDGVPESAGFEDELNGPAVSKVEDFLNKNVTPTYTPSEALVEYIEISPVAVVQGIVELQLKLDTFTRKIIDYLNDNRANRPPVNDYILARAVNDYSVIQAFEEEAFDIEGTVEADMLPVLLDLHDEMDMLFRFSNSYLYQNRLVEPIPFDKLQVEEEDIVKHAIELDKNLQLDTDALHEQNHLLQYLHHRVEMVDRFVDGLDGIITTTPEDAYGVGVEAAIGSIENIHTDIVKEDITNTTPAIFSSGFLLDSMKQMNTLRFEKQAQYVYDSSQRMSRLVDRDTKAGLLAQVVALQYEKLNSRHLFQWMERISPEDDLNPLNAIFFDLLEGSEEVLDLADTLVQDLYRTVELERIQLEDYADSLYAKKLIRDVHHMTKTVEPRLA